MKINKAGVAYFYGVLGLIGIAFFITLSAFYEYPEWFYQAYPDIEKFVGPNVVSPWCTFSFFTNQTVIIFSIWGILLALSQMSKNAKLRDFLLKPSVVGFVVTNHIITTACYTVFELCGEANFGLYALVPRAFVGLFGSIYMHYILFIFAILLLFIAKPTEKDTKNRHFAYTYLILYFFLVKITGMYCFDIEWYPYPIFDTEMMIDFIGLDGGNIWLNILAFLIIFAALFALYYFLYKFVRKCFVRQSGKPKVIESL